MGILMVIEILSYNESILNPLLKIAITLLFAMASCLLYVCRRRYGGLLHQISTLLLFTAVAATFSSFFRFQGDFYETYKWGESIIGLFFVVLSLIIALFIRKKIHAIACLFEGNEESE